MYDVLDDAVTELQLVEVFAYSDGDYEWAEFRAWEAPWGRFYWFGDTGCSCYGYGENFTSWADFGDGDRAALEEAYRTWMGEHACNDAPQVVIDGIDRLRRL